MNHNEKVLLELLRIAIWNLPVEHFHTAQQTDWNAVLNMAEDSTVGPLVAQSIQRISEYAEKDQHIPDAIIDRCLTLQFTAIRNSQKLNSVLLTVNRAIKERAHFSPILLKGQACAQRYPEPALRTCGDIDLFVGADHVDAAIESLTGIYDEGSVDRAHEKHYNVKCQGVEIELHRTVITLNNEPENDHINHWTLQRLKTQPHSTAVINGQDIRIPDPLFETVFLFYHLWRHYLYEGIGLRQLCDWTLCLHANHSHINHDELRQVLRSFGIMDAWQSFGSLIVNSLGLPREEFPLYNRWYQFKAPYLAHEIITIGNFGREGRRQFEQGKPQGWFSHRFYTFTHKSHTLLRRFIICPKDGWPKILHFYTNGLSRLFK